MACQHCGGRGFVFPEGGEIAYECECVAEARLKKQRSDLWAAAGFPSEVRDITEYQGSLSRPIINKLMAYLADWETYRHDSLFVVGEPSTQKTTVWRWIGTQLLNRGIRVKYILFSQLMRKVMQLSSYDTETRQDGEDYILSLYDAELLIIDEAFDPTKAVIWSSGQHGAAADSFFRELLELHRCPCVFISNFPITGIHKVFSPAMQELITRNVAAILKFEDRLDFNPDIKKEGNLWTT